MERILLDFLGSSGHWGLCIWTMLLALMESKTQGILSQIWLNFSVWSTIAIASWQQGGHQEQPQGHRGRMEIIGPRSQLGKGEALSRHLKQRKTKEGTPHILWKFQLSLFSTQWCYLRRKRTVLSQKDSGKGDLWFLLLVAYHITKGQPWLFGPLSQCGRSCPYLVWPFP